MIGTGVSPSNMGYSSSLHADRIQFSSRFSFLPSYQEKPKNELHALMSMKKMYSQLILAACCDHQLPTMGQAEHARIVLGIIGIAGIIPE